MRSSSELLRLPHHEATTAFVGSLFRVADKHPDSGESLSEAFWAVARQFRRGSAKTLAPWDITPSHGRALAVLGRHGAMRLSELSEHLNIAARSTTEVIDALEERGLVGRRPDPDDRRATIVHLTEDGEDLNQMVRAARMTEAEAFFGALSSTDRAHLARILSKLRNQQQ